MNLAQCIDPLTWHCRADCWKRGDRLTLMRPPSCSLLEHIYTPAQAKILEALDHSPRPLTIIEIHAATGISRFTIYDCVVQMAQIAHTGMRRREKLYWLAERRRPA